MFIFLTIAKYYDRFNCAIVLDKFTKKNTHFQLWSMFLFVHQHLVGSVPFMPETPCCSLGAMRSSEGSLHKIRPCISHDPLPTSHSQECRRLEWITSEGHGHWGSLEMLYTLNYSYCLELLYDLFICPWDLSR